MSHNLIRICIFGTSEKLKLLSSQCPDFETNEYDIYSFQTDLDLFKIIADLSPQVIISIGNLEEFSVLNKSPIQIRKKWIHYNKADLQDFEKIGSDIMSCYINDTLQERKNLPKLVSVFTPVYSPGDLINRPFSSLKNQWYDNWEWILVDDSNDNGKTFKQLTEISKQDPRVQVFKSNKHYGNIGKLKKQACGLSSGEYLVELDHDDELTPNCLLDIVNAFSETKCGFVYTDFAEVFPDGSPFMYGDGWGFKYGSYRWENFDGKNYAVANSPNINPKTIRHIVAAPNHARAWDSDFYRSIGGHNQNIHVADDYELMIRTFLHTEMVKISKLCYIQWRNKPGAISKGNTHQERNKEIQRLVRYFSQFYDKQIHDRFLKLGIDDYLWKEGESSFHKLNHVPNPEIEQHCTLEYKKV